MNIKNELGVALILTLFVVVILITLSCVFVLRTVNENRIVFRDVKSSQAFYVAEAGGNMAIDQLDTFINEYMREYIQSLNNTAVENLFDDLSEGTYDSMDFLVDLVRHDGERLLDRDGEEAVYTHTETDMGVGTYSFEITITRKSAALGVEAYKWEFYYNFTVIATGAVEENSRQITLTGDLTVRCQKDNFAKYALFTNEQTSQTGSPVWFNSDTRYEGPVHTNGRFNFALNPAGTFNGKVTQTEITARFYNNNFPVLLDADSNGTTDVPTFNEDFERGADSINLASLTQKQELIDQVDAGETYGSKGVYLPNDGTTLTGGIYINGNSSLALSVDNNNAVYTITQDTTTYTITVDRATDQTTVDDGTTVVTYYGLPDGVDDTGTVIYSDKNITSLSGVVQGDTNLTIASENDVYIQGDLVYSDYTDPEGETDDPDYIAPHAEGADNMLGIVSWTGDVFIGTSAPDDVSIHGTILAQEGVFTVEAYDDTVEGSRGSVTLLGGVITNQYGAFGTFSGTTGENISGYGRNFVYDQRMAAGSNPPYFPTLDIYTAFSRDIADNIVWQERSN